MSWLDRFFTSKNYSVIQDEGVNLPSRQIFDFIGAGVTAVDDPDNDRTKVTIPGGAGNPAGSNTWVQFNDSGAFGANSGFAFNKSTHVATLLGAVAVNAAASLSGMYRGPIGSFIDGTGDLLTCRNSLNTDDLCIVNVNDAGGNNDWMTFGINSLGGGSFDAVNFYAKDYLLFSTVDADGALYIVNNRNLVIGFTSGTDVGGGRGVLGMEASMVNPSGPIPNGIVLFPDAADNYLKYLREDGSVIILNGGGASAGAMGALQYSSDGAGGFAGSTLNFIDVDDTLHTQDSYHDNPELTGTRVLISSQEIRQSGTNHLTCQFFYETLNTGSTILVHTVSMAANEDVTITIEWSVKKSGGSGDGIAGTLFTKWTRNGAGAPVQCDQADVKNEVQIGSCDLVLSTVASSNDIRVELAGANSAKGLFEVRVARTVVT